ncbi:MAG: hypothetical protein HYR96_00785 [Deltaproteobacteria bacterium]|nr:hypothetical protein [Deltaproteobacteria bacterium]MBI3296096.1 hypothetical protein [Deltaproteobacteria bacterium]
MTRSRFSHLLLASILCVGLVSCAKSELPVSGNSSAVPSAEQKPAETVVSGLGAIVGCYKRFYQPQEGWIIGHRGTDNCAGAVGKTVQSPGFFFTNGEQAYFVSDADIEATNRDWFKKNRLVGKSIVLPWATKVAVLLSEGNGLSFWHSGGNVDGEDEQPLTSFREVCVGDEAAALDSISLAVSQEIIGHLFRSAPKQSVDPKSVNYCISVLGRHGEGLKRFLSR